MSRFVVVCAFLAVASALPVQPEQEKQQVPIIAAEYHQELDGRFDWMFDAADGTHHDQVGVLKTVGDHQSEAVSGNYRYTDPDGKEHSVSYTADENGFQVQSDDVPVTPPVPEHVQKTVEYINSHPAENQVDQAQEQPAQVVQQQQPQGVQQIQQRPVQQYQPVQQVQQHPVQQQQPVQQVQQHPVQPQQPVQQVQQHPVQQQQPVQQVQQLPVQQQQTVQQVQQHPVQQQQPVQQVPQHSVQQHQPVQQAQQQHQIQQHPVQQH